MSAVHPTEPDTHGDLHRLMPAALTALTGGSQRLLPLPEGIRGVAVLVVDGLGHHQLTTHADDAPTLAAAQGPVARAPFPTTTATSLATIGTGLPAGRHGLAGYSFAVAGYDEPLFALTWGLGAHDPTYEASDRIVPERLQPEPTIFEQARATPVRPVTVLREEFVTSGLTRAGLRGGDIMVAAGLERTLQAVHAALDGPTPTLVYAHHPNLDFIGHLHAPGSDEWRAELTRIDNAIANAAGSLPRDTALVVTADHGMVAIGEDGFVELAEHPQLLDGVTMLCGDARARALHTTPGATEDVLAAWREHAGDRAHVVTGEQAVAAGWFGPQVSDTVADRVGDVVISARDLDVAWVHRDHDLLGGRLPGMHGALTAEEQDVPLLTFVAGHA